MQHSTKAEGRQTSTLILYSFIQLLFLKWILLIPRKRHLYVVGQQLLGNITIGERRAELKDSRKQCLVIEYFSVYSKPCVGLTCPTSSRELFHSDMCNEET